MPAKGKSYTVLTDKMLIDIEDAVAAGHETSKDIAVNIGISIGTMEKLRAGTIKNSPDSKKKISEAIKKGSDKQRENMKRIALSSLVKLVQGYDYEEIKTEAWKDDKGRIERQHIVKTMKHVQANVTAVIFTICNVDPENFKSINRQIDQRVPIGEDKLVQAYGAVTKFMEGTHKGAKKPVDKKKK